MCACLWSILCYKYEPFVTNGTSSGSFVVSQGTCWRIIRAARSSAKHIGGFRLDLGTLMLHTTIWADNHVLPRTGKHPRLSGRAFPTRNTQILLKCEAASAALMPDSGKEVSQNVLCSKDCIIITFFSPSSFLGVVCIFNVQLSSSFALCTSGLEWM